MIDRHFHWKFVGWNASDQMGDDRVRYAVNVSVIGYEDEASAKIAAQQVLNRSNLSLVDVWECAACGFQQKNAELVADMIGKM